MLAVCWFACSGGGTLAAAPSSSPPGTILLRNGETIEGMLSRGRDGLTVELARGGTITVPHEEVMFAGRDLQQVYRFQRVRAGRSWQGQLGLAEWCLQHGLLPEARRTWAHCRRIAPATPLLERFAARLVHAERLQVRRSSATDVAASSVPATPAATDGMPTNLSRHTKTDFVRRIQPLLVNRCGAGGCHHPRAGSSFVLEPSVRGAADGALRWANLRAVVQQVNSNQVETSVLLQKAKASHGSQAAPSRPLKSTHYAQLRDWVLDAARQMRAAAAQEDGSQISRSPSEPSQNKAVAPSARKSNSQASPPVEPSVLEDIDPFDPRRFNALPRRPKTEETRTGSEQQLKEGDAFGPRSPESHR